VFTSNGSVAKQEPMTNEEFTFRIILRIIIMHRFAHYVWLAYNDSFAFTTALDLLLTFSILSLQRIGIQSEVFRSGSWQHIVLW